MLPTCVEHTICSDLAAMSASASASLAQCCVLQTRHEVASRHIQTPEFQAISESLGTFTWEDRFTIFSSGFLDFSRKRTPTQRKHCVDQLSGHWMLCMKSSSKSQSYKNDTTRNSRNHIPNMVLNVSCRPKSRRAVVSSNSDPVTGQRIHYLEDSLDASIARGSRSAKSEKCPGAPGTRNLEVL